jgi:uncharacterized membrane protein YfcA
MDAVLDNMQSIRNNLNGDFTEKVRRLNELTSVLAAGRETALSAGLLPTAAPLASAPSSAGNDATPPHEFSAVVQQGLSRTLEAKQAVLSTSGRSKWQRVVIGCLFAFFFMLLGHAVLPLVPFDEIRGYIHGLPEQFDWQGFSIMTLAGFLAQMVDGSMGLGYGTISTTFLLAYGVSPAIVSSRVHSARVFSSGVSGYSHHRFGNINKRLFRAIVVPGCIGAILGATLAFYGQKYATWVKVPLSVYTVYLGYYILRKAFAKRVPGSKVKRAGWLASVGGFTDAFAGGGWGTLVTSTLISKRKNPRYVVGSVCLAEFFVVLTSSITFFILLKNLPLMDIAGMILGGVVAAPIAARLAGKLPIKTMFIAVGTLVILTSCNTLWKALAHALH